MLKTIFFDCDGVLVLSRQRFLDKFSDEFDVPKAKIKPFFQSEFLRCKLGQADLKQELQKFLPAWGWKKPVDELLKYWFTSENLADKNLIDYIQSLRAEGIKCYLTTNQEKYRFDYLFYHLALSTIFDGTFPSCQVGFLKSQPEFWQKVYNINMGNKHEALVVDDDPQTVDAARKFGFYAHPYISMEGLEAAVEGLLKV